MVRAESQSKEFPEKECQIMTNIRLGKEITRSIRTEGVITMGEEVRMQMFNVQSIELMAVGG